MSLWLVSLWQCAVCGVNRQEVSTVLAGNERKKFQNRCGSSLNIDLKSVAL